MTAEQVAPAIYAFVYTVMGLMLIGFIYDAVKGFYESLKLAPDDSSRKI